MIGSRVCVVTGGAGFIGCAIAHGLLARFDHVIALDSLHPQIHPTRQRPTALPDNVELLVGDVTDPNAWKSLLDRAKPAAIVHLAAETGTGQSLTEGCRHSHVNVTGTTTMLDALASVGHVPDQIILSSSRAVYGEGAWRASQDSPLVYPGQRTREQLAQDVWDFPGLVYASTEAASTVPQPVSVYAATKLAQEHILKAWTSSFGGRLKILRLQNVYGPGQALANPYTGIVSLFCRLARSGQSIPLYEDGLMLRDFVFIEDVAAAILRASDCDEATGKTLDVGTGGGSTVEGLARSIAAHYGAPDPHVCGKYRFGDVRHAACNVQPTEALLKWTCAHDVAAGVVKLAAWIETQLPPSQ
jgi:dTDP-L-rhamnose 4-epimerase